MTRPDGPDSPQAPQAVVAASNADALRPADTDPLPAGISAITVTNYKVGPYTYGRLADAMAEYQRQKVRAGS